MSGWDLEITVKKIRGSCDFGHKVGDKIYYDGKTLRGEICPSALAAIMPTIYAMAWGAEFPWDGDKDITTVACTDINNQVCFQIKRLRNRPWKEGFRVAKKGGGYKILKRKRK